MAWTYSGDPSSSDKDAVRFLVGDTEQDEPLTQDEEINWVLSKNPNIYAAAAKVAFAISAKFATLEQSFKVGPIQEDYGYRAKSYKDMALKLEQQAKENQSLQIYAGGISASERETADADTDLLQTAIRTDIHDPITLEDTIDE